MIKQQTTVQLISYHPKTHELALFSDGTTFWIGSYFPHRTDCNVDDPFPYAYYAGDFDSKEQGIETLNNLQGNEF